VKKFVSAFVFAVALVPAAAFAAATASLTVRIENVSDKGGDLRIGVYNEASFSVRGSKPVTGKIVSAKAGEMIVTFDGIAPGEYGVKTYQDENRNGKLDTVMGMMPSEPYGMSNDAQPKMGPPPWEDARITLKPGANTIVIHLH
jgi:uncharacterized protein (DUF2141 family)